MNDSEPIPSKDAGDALVGHVGAKADRKLKARHVETPGIWSGLGMMGLVGWSVAVPTLIGAALGIWLDRHYASGHAWTLPTLVAGLMLGCVNAWHWVSQEDRREPPSEEDNDDHR